MSEIFGDGMSARKALESDLQRLAERPFVVGRDEMRRGARVVVTTTTDEPAEQDIVTMTVSIVLLHLPAPDARNVEADAAAIVAATEALGDPDVHVRMSACQQIGQIGGPSARSALERALNDESLDVRGMAERALAVADVPRVTPQDLAALWSEVRIDAARKSVTLQARRNGGRASLPGVQRGAWCQLQVPQEVQVRMAAGPPRVSRWVVTDPDLKVTVVILPTPDGLKLVAVSPEPPSPETANVRLALVLTNRATNAVDKRLPIRSLEAWDQAPAPLQKEYDLPAYATGRCWLRQEEYAVALGSDPFLLSLARGNEG